MSLPFDGLRVLDMTRLLPGAICTLMLADLGAEVIKIESPDGGDYARWMPPMIAGQGAYFQATNRGKQSVILNLKVAEGQAVLHKLVETADVVIESYRPGVPARIRADAATLRAINPRLIYCSLSGWGQAGGYALTSGHDLNYATKAGLIGEGNQPQPIGGQVADVGGAYLAFGAISAALFQRERTGEGATIDAALFDAALPVVGYAWVEAVARQGDISVHRGMLSGRYACYNVYKTRDGAAVTLAALEEKFWSNFCRAIQRQDLIDDYQAPARQRYLLTEVAQIFSLKTADEWDALLLNADCCYGRVPTVETLLDDPGVRERGILQVDAEGSPLIRTPIKLGDQIAPVQAAPAYGQHTVDVLRAAGYDESALDQLRGAGAIP